MKDVSLYQRYVSTYVKSDVRTAGGKRKSIDKGDELARLLRGRPMDELIKICSANNIDTTRWTHLNFGRFRMQVGRALRLIMKKGGTVKIGAKRVKA